MPYTAPNTMNAATQQVATWFINGSQRFNSFSPGDDRPWDAEAVRQDAYEYAYDHFASGEDADPDDDIELCNTIVVDSLCRHMGNDPHIDWVAIAAAHNNYHAQQA